LTTVKLGAVRLEGRAAQTFTLGLLFIVIIVALGFRNAFKQSGTSLMEILTSDSTRFAILSGIVILVIYAAIKAKIDDLPTLLGITLLVGGVAFIGLYIDKIRDVLVNFKLPSFDLFEDQPDTQLEQKVRIKVYEEYADPNKDEVYFVGAQTLNAIADNAGVDRGGFGLLGFSITHEDYIGIVYTDQIIRIDDEMPTPQTQWNNIISGRMFPLVVYVDNKLYVVWCRIDWKKVDLVLLPVIDGYNLDRDYRHIPKADAQMIFSRI